MTRVLIVEDDELNRKLISSIVEDMNGFTVAGLAATAEDAKNLASNNRVFFDLAIVDGQFPLREGERIDSGAGRMTADYLKRVRPGIQILACSGNSEDALDWAHAAVRKPFNIDALEAALRALASSTQPEPS